MSPLAFDKQGRPFSFLRRTAKLLVRRFKNQGTRGTCAAVLDAVGEPLYADPETDYLEFRKLVGNVPGFYRLDQCDEDGNELDDAEAAYVSIDVTRNAAAPGESDPNPLVIIEHLVAIQADCMKTMAMQQAAIIAASAEILRAPFRPAPPPIEKKEDAEEKEEEDDDERDDDEGDDQAELEPDPWAAWRPLLKMAEPHLPKLGAFLYEQFAAFMKKNATPPPAAAPDPAPAPAPTPAPAAAPSPGPKPAGAAAGSSSPPPPSAPPSGAATATAQTASTEAPPATDATAATAPSETAKPSATEHAATSSATETVSPTSASTAAHSVPTPDALAVVPADAAPRNAPSAPTPAQWAHLAAIRERLSAKDCAVAENAIMRMNPDVLAEWLARLSALSVDDAVTTIRSMIGQIRAQRPPERG